MVESIAAGSVNGLAVHTFHVYGVFYGWDRVNGSVNGVNEGWDSVNGVNGVNGIRA